MISTYPQPVKRDDTLNIQLTKPFNMIDNYVYLYHTDTLIALPLYPEQISDTMQISYTPSMPLSRSAPIYSYSHSGPRSMSLQLPLHRDMMNQINVSTSRLNIPELSDEDYVDLMIRQLQAAAVPKYAASEKMVNPPMVAVRFGNCIFCKGIVDGNVNVIHSGPILTYDKYALATVEFTVTEVDPYDADVILLEGGMRGLRTTLENRVHSSVVGGLDHNPPLLPKAKPSQFAQRF